jgi:WD40 repeat protein
MDVNPPRADTIAEYNSDGAVLSPNGRLILTWQEWGNANLWRAEVGAMLADLSENDSDLSDFGAAFSPDSRLALTWWNKWISDNEYERKGILRLWNVQDGSSAISSLHYSSVMTKGFFSPEGRWIFAMGEFKEPRVWHVNDGSIASPKFLQILPFTDNLTFSPEGSHVLVWSGDSVQLLDISADYDFPPEHLPLLVEALTGTSMDDVGNVTVLGSEAWPKRKAEYAALAEKHLEACQYGNANFYARQKQDWE